VSPGSDRPAGPDGAQPLGRVKDHPRPRQDQVRLGRKRSPHPHNTLATKVIRARVHGQLRAWGWPRLPCCQSRPFPTPLSGCRASTKHPGTSRSAHGACGGRRRQLSQVFRRRPRWSAWLALTDASTPHRTPTTPSGPVSSGRASRYAAGGQIRATVVCATARRRPGRITRAAPLRHIGGRTVR
jgi:hypothetical protein